MEDFVVAAKITDIAPGSMKTVQVSGKSIAVANVEGKYFAIDDACSHAQCSLGTEGALDGNVTICGCHDAKFDVTTGKVLALPAVTDVKSYKVKVENSNVLICLTQK